MPTIEQLEKLLSVDPNDPFVHYGIGQERAKLGEHAQAIDCYNQALRLDPSYCYAYYFKAISLKELGRRDEAQEIIRVGIDRAQSIGDMKARSELETLLQTIS